MDQNISETLHYCTVLFYNSLLLLHFIFNMYLVPGLQKLWQVLHDKLKVKRTLHATVHYSVILSLSDYFKLALLTYANHFCK
jgi:hypothetical protein